MNRRFRVGDVTLRYWAAARAAAGTAEDEFHVGDAGVGLAEALSQAVARHGPDFERVLTLASVLVDSRRVDRSAYAALRLPPGTVVEILPPFAGG